MPYAGELFLLWIFPLHGTTTQNVTLLPHFYHWYVSQSSSLPLLYSACFCWRIKCQGSFSRSSRNICPGAECILGSHVAAANLDWDSQGADWGKYYREDDSAFQETNAVRSFFNVLGCLLSCYDWVLFIHCHMFSFIAVLSLDPHVT